MASRRTRSTRPACLSFLPGLLLPDELQTMVLEAAVVKPAEEEGERASLDLKPWAMLALTNAHWADHIREMLIPQLWRMRKPGVSIFLPGFDAALTATTLRMPPAALVDWLGALSTQKLQETKRKDDEEEDTTTLGWLTDHCMLSEVGNAQSHLLRKAAWTPELLVKATSILVTPRFDDLQGSGYAAYDVSMVVNDVAAKTHSSISSLAIGSVAAKAPDTMTKAFYLINIYGSFVDGIEFDVCGAKKLGATLADLTRSGQASPADIAAVAHQLQEEELMTRDWAPDFMQESPFAWSRAALLAWASRADTSRWSRRDKRELLGSKGLGEWVQACVDDVWVVPQHYYDNPPDFDPAAATALAADLGQLAALVYPIDDVIALLKSFVAKERGWRERVVTHGVGDSEWCWPRASLDKHYAAHLLSAWARASGFPALASSDDCAKVAKELAGWPLSFREAASFVVLGWVADGNGGGDGAKLVNAVLHGGVKPPAKPKKQ